MKKSEYIEAQRVLAQAARYGVAKPHVLSPSLEEYRDSKEQLAYMHTGVGKRNRKLKSTRERIRDRVKAIRDRVKAIRDKLSATG